MAARIRSRIVGATSALLVGSRTVAARTMSGPMMIKERLDLRAEPEDAALRVLLGVVGDVFERHRVAGERHRDAGAELDLVGVLGREQERIVVPSLS
jgi:hypothetical protein